MKNLKRKKRNLAICLGVASIYATDAQSWPRNGISFKNSDMTVDESGINRKKSELLISTDTNYDVAEIGQFFWSPITYHDYEKNKDDEKFQINARFWIDGELYVCKSMSLKQFQETYGAQFDTTTDPNKPPQKWAISVYGEAKYKDKPHNKMKQCKWHFWPII